MSRENKSAHSSMRKMEYVKLIAVKTSYLVEPPFPDLLTVNQLVDVHCPPLQFRTADVTEHFGNVGIIESNWTEEKQDWYLGGIDFVCIRTLDRGSETVSGPFKFVRKEGAFAILEAADTSQFCHPTFLKKESRDGTKFQSSLAWMWSMECLCESNQDQITEEEEDPVEWLLSQNICICKPILGDGYKCFCGYPTDKHEEGSEDEEGSADDSSKNSGGNVETSED
ncbi:hypothetical protein R1sor_027034 [Riccia sorocarpa]|uniref:Uncharacterized protein n=1 Tax=Riccia sorocarpa TaxID=122646 RepID=A0ABD3GES3_9MARC